MLYASEFSDLPGSGEITAVDQVVALEEMPTKLREALEPCSSIKLWSRVIT